MTNLATKDKPLVGCGVDGKPLVDFVVDGQSFSFDKLF
jgi:hypothetical protein